MTNAVIDAAQRTAAKVAGWAYLAALVPAVFAEFYVRGRLVAGEDAARTTLNIVTHERLFRLGIASNLTVFAIDVALIAALYVALKPIGRGLALLALCWGMIETGVLVAATLSDLDVLRVLAGAAYLKAFDAEQLQAMARLRVGAHGAAYGVGLVFAGLRSAAYCYLWLDSRFVPRALAGWGIAASALMGACAFAFIVVPELSNVVPVWIYGGPIFLFELSMGGWLVSRELRPPRGAEP